MSYSAIIEYLQPFSSIYFASSKKEKGPLLKQACQITGWHAKSILRRLKNPQNLINNRRGKSGRKKKYDPTEVLEHIRSLWISMDRITAKRMKAAFKDWLPFYENPRYNNRIKFLLETMSVSTLARFIRQIKAFETKNPKGLTSTSPARYMKNKVPINTLDIEVRIPGHAQADTVAHCGNTLLGSFINTVTLTDIHTTWTENRALYEKKGKQIKEMLLDIKQSLPFHLFHVNTDSGSEFLNRPVYDTLSRSDIKFTRSRAYKKNDNCYVEQKNFTHVRELFGYQRFEDKVLVDLMNDIYKNYWNPYQNFFLPTFKLIEKTRVGAKIKKKYDEPKTPYQRVIDSEVLAKEEKESLKEKKQSLNPFKLKEQIEEKLKLFFQTVEDLKRQKEIA